MFVEAIEASQGKRLGGGKCWYPYSYLAGYLLRRARMLLEATRCALLLASLASPKAVVANKLYL